MKRRKTEYVGARGIITLISQELLVDRTSNIYVYCGNSKIKPIAMG
jgi:hypothetical protein